VKEVSISNELHSTDGSIISNIFKSPAAGVAIRLWINHRCSKTRIGILWQTKSKIKSYSTNANGQTLLQQYNNERTTIAFTDDERTRIIDVVNQPFEQFAIHPDFAIAENRYNNGSLAFLCEQSAVEHTRYQRRLFFFNSDGAVCAQYDATNISKN
jgi:phosphorylcholine metabolism protein LicD